MVGSSVLLNRHHSAPVSCLLKSRAALPMEQGRAAARPRLLRRSLQRHHSECSTQSITLIIFLFFHLFHLYSSPRRTLFLFAEILFTQVHFKVLLPQIQVHVVLMIVIYKPKSPTILLQVQVRIIDLLILIDLSWWLCRFLRSCKLYLFS